MTEQETLISEIINRIFRAEPDNVGENGEQYIEKGRIIKIIRGLETV